MYCQQCEQTMRSQGIAGCAGQRGACGKEAETADLQDILVFQIRGIAEYIQLARQFAPIEAKFYEFVKFGLFTTLTNVNFDSAYFTDLINQAGSLADELQAICFQQGGEQFAPPRSGPAAFQPAGSRDMMLAQTKKAGVSVALADPTNADAHGLFTLNLTALKGLCAYSHHASCLGYSDQNIDDDTIRLLAALSDDEKDLEKMLALSMEIGQLNLRVMELLDQANTGTFGQPEISQVRITPKAGPAILVSGHDLHDLAVLLEQTRDSGINVYTHGEMLPAHSYPGLNKYPHLVGNYGGAWQNQQREFADFPGAILMTSNCLTRPSHYYEDRIFTTGPVGWPGIPHISDGDFAPLIHKAVNLMGYSADREPRFITTGFGHNSVLGVADKIIENVRNGDIKHFFVIGGCDGAKPGRNYYTELADQAPDDTLILTLGCNKFRFNRKEYGNINGIPRLLDMGQCNDAFSAIKVASALSEAFKCDINELPMSLMISWFEQKATAVLLSLLAAGVRGIRLGPTLPGFLTPNLINILVERFDLRPNQSAETDLADALKRA